MNKSIINDERIVLGTCYYPEHWPEGMWEDDLRRMKENGIEVIRIAEFAWSKIEPEEGYFTYEFFDHFLEIAAKCGMKVIFSTPTATPPAWLTDKYPEALNANIDGVLYRHGSRRHYNYNSPKYRELCARIVEKSASHYASNKCIIGWQIDNEFNCENSEFYSESDTKAFREFLINKYKTLDVLNEAWGTVFWNQTYTAWDEIYVPRTTNGYAFNPHMKLDYKRFISDSVLKFAKMQSDILKKYIKDGDFITTNGLFGNLDSKKLTNESLDVFMYDSYPNFAYCLHDYERGEKGLRDRESSRSLSEIRAISSNFGIMEQQSGANGWCDRMEAPTPRPGQMTLWTMQSIAHGADFISYFRWRTCVMGTEIYWHGILDYSGRDNRRLKEVNEIWQKVTKMKEIAGSKYQAQVGIIKDYDNIWDSEIDVWHRRVEQESQRGLFYALQKTHTPFDYCYIDYMTAEELQNYKVLFYPHAVILSKEMAEKLEQYVEAGGILVTGCRTGYKDKTGRCVMEKLPALLQKLCGTDIPEYSLTPPDDGMITADWGGTVIEAPVFNDLLLPLGDAVIEAVYQNSYYAGTPAMISNPYGRGRAYYYGGTFTELTSRVFLDKLNAASPYKDKLELPEGCELAVREKDGRGYYFILNYLKTEAVVKLKVPFVNLFNNQEECGEIILKPYEARVLSI